MYLAGKKRQKRHELISLLSLRSSLKLSFRRIHSRKTQIVKRPGLDSMHSVVSQRMFASDLLIRSQEGG